MPPRHVLTATQFDRDTLDAIFAVATRLVSQSRAGCHPLHLKHRKVAIVMMEPSTRTRLSFQEAVEELGGRATVSEAAGQTSSLYKGESFEDMARIIEGYGFHALVVRSDKTGAPADAAKVVNIPVLNAGDGAGEHPTQALLDLYTIWRLAEREELTLALCGDLLNGRTVRSLTRLILRAYDGTPCPVRFLLCSPPELRMSDDVLGELESAGVDYAECGDFIHAVTEADVLYQTRLQTERFEDSDLIARLEKAQERFSLTADNVGRMKPDAIILHPLPRLRELAPEVDRDPRARYFEQARNGLFVRMALLIWSIDPDQFKKI